MTHAGADRAASSDVDPVTAEASPFDPQPAPVDGAPGLSTGSAFARRRAVWSERRSRWMVGPPPPPPPPGLLEPGEVAPGHHRRRGLRGLLPRPIWQVGRLLVLALLIEYLVVPQLAGPRKVLHLLTQVSPVLLLAAVALEVASLLAYAYLTRSILPPASRLSLWTILRVQLTTLSVSHCAPGGGATGTALGYRLYGQFGAEPKDVGFVMGVQGVGSAVVLNVILWVSLIVSIPVWGFSAVYVMAAVVGVVLLGLSVAMVYALTAASGRMGELLERVGSHLPFVDQVALHQAFDQLSERISNLGHHREIIVKAAAWATLNWLLDAGSLWVFVRAFGHWVNPDGLLVAYGLANVLAAIPLTPGGLGVVEATLTTLLVGFGTTRGVATLGVVVYRLVNFWAPIPIGGLAYLSLQIDRQGGAAGARRAVQMWNWHRPFGRRVGPESSEEPTGA